MTQLTLFDESAYQSPFDRIRHIAGDGAEYWLGRELMVLLDYSTWQYFKPAIDRAKAACKNSGHHIQNNFMRTHNPIVTGKGRKQEIADLKLSRYACYLIAQNGDPAKQAIAEAQTYFAIQTRRQE